MRQVLATVESHEEIKGQFRLLTIQVPDIACFAKPGQFVHVRCGDTLDPLLRRPLSLHKIEADHGRLSLLYRVAGRGTALLAGKQPGEQVDIMGPLGKGFTIPEHINRAIVVGGGIGAAPLLPLVEALVLAKVDTTVILGAACQEVLVGGEA
ncbi:MAG TPA: FAD-binding oxidoreductase, partial [Bacillota bacterium]|nr:FAD-binding oxidoreductase [Bacillota bacterium]